MLLCGLIDETLHAAFCFVQASGAAASADPATEASGFPDVLWSQHSLGSKSRVTVEDHRIMALTIRRPRLRFQRPGHQLFIATCLVRTML